ncbi:MAG: DUF1343 domain-containing protein [Verrucomicrobia bacterium]|nr:DUF1343 domain-containing protein [Verrucomicrobiota bacterium]
MRKWFLFLFMPYLLFSQEVKVELGIDRFFKEDYSKLLFGKRVGLLTNPSGVTSSLQPTLQLFFEKEKGFQITALFAPEHGIDGKSYAGEEVENRFYKDKIPLYSLHGKTRRPTKEMLQKVDVIVFDIQDIGVRSYTFASTLFYVMEEAAKAKISVIVLDRPNPLGGLLVDGPMLQEKFRSFVGYINVPYCHGMTIGELATFFNEEYRIGCDLQVVPMRGWTREMAFSETGLLWIPTSPQIPEEDTPLFYATTGLLGELDVVNIGVGYTLPFKVVGAPWIDADRFAKTLNEQKIDGVSFTPIHYRPFFGSLRAIDCHGVQIHITNQATYRPLKVQAFLLGILKSLYPERVEKLLHQVKEEKRSLFYKVCGNDQMFKLLLQEKFISWKLCNFQKDERDAFQKKRAKYLLY